MVEFVVFILGIVLLWSSILFYKRNDSVENGACYSVFAVITIMIFHSVVARVLQLLGIPIGAISVGLVDIVCATILWVYINKTNTRQKYRICVVDIIVLVIIVITAYIVSSRQLGRALINFNFLSDCDAARHYIYAKNVANNGELNSLYFSALNSGLWMDALRYMVPSYFFYVIFNINEVLVLTLNGFLLWIYIRNYLNSNIMLIFGLIISVFYTLGHPWNSLVFGTAYLSTGIMISTFIMMVFRDFEAGKLKSRLTIILIGMSLFALFTSYSLFLPIFVIAIYLKVIYNWCIKSGKVLKKRAIITAVITLCGILGGVFLCYLWLFTDRFESSLGGLAMWGNIYYNLYSDFALILPFVLWNVFHLIKERKIDFSVIALISIIMYLALLLFAEHRGKLSLYYYYKNYSILWMILFICFMKGFVSFINQSKKTKCYIMVFTAVLYLFFCNFEICYNQEAPFVYNQESKLSQFFRIYSYNADLSKQRCISDDCAELYTTAARLAHEGKAFIPYIGEYKWHEWTYFALADLEHNDVISGMEYQQAIDEIKKYKYILYVYSEPSGDVDISDYLDSLEILYSNSAGSILKTD